MTILFAVLLSRTFSYRSFPGDPDSRDADDARGRILVRLFFNAEDCPT